jgi:hypothetical protein
MFNFPFIRFPYHNYYPYYSYIQNRNDIPPNEEKNTSNVKDKNEKNNEDISKPKAKKNTEKRSFKYSSIGPLNFINPFLDNFNEDEPIVEILGLRLYLDDLIIIGILFLLYKEDVQDEMLFLALILLLIT